MQGDENKPENRWPEFHEFLHQQIELFEPDLLAEEMSLDGLTAMHSSETVLRMLSDGFEIAHVFVDPGNSERKKLGIKSRRDIAKDLGYGTALSRAQSRDVTKIDLDHWNIRENHWLDILDQHTFERCLFVIGSDHVQRLLEKLDEKGQDYEVLDEDFGNLPDPVEQFLSGNT